MSAKCKHEYVIVPMGDSPGAALAVLCRKCGREVEIHAQYRGSGAIYHSFKNPGNRSPRQLAEDMLREVTPAKVGPIPPILPDVRGGRALRREVAQLRAEVNQLRSVVWRLAGWGRG